MKAFSVRDKQRKITFRYLESVNGIACNYSMGVKDKFSLRTADGQYLTGLSKRQAIALLT